MCKIVKKPLSCNSNVETVEIVEHIFEFIILSAGHCDPPESGERAD